MIYANKLHDFATAYRVDDPARHGAKRVVCGCCVQEGEATDPRRSAGHFECEQCGHPLGRDAAYERADELLANICPVAERQRMARLTSNAKVSGAGTASAGLPG